MYKSLNNELKSIYPQLNINSNINIKKKIENNSSYKFLITNVQNQSSKFISIGYTN